MRIGTGRRKWKASRESGMSMIELLIAMTVMAVGMSGILTLVLLAMIVNNTAKTDTTGTILSQMVIEQIQMMPANAVGNLTVTDCSGINRTITLAPAGGTVPPAAGGGAGARLLADGSIDWSQAPAAVPVGYQMTYAACGPNNQWMFYDVRWNVMTGTTVGGAVFTKMVTVSARPAAAQFGGMMALKNYALPVTLRTISGM